MIACFLSKLPHAFVGNIGGQFLKTRIHKVFIWVSIRPNIESVCNKVLGAFFYLFHVYPTRQVQVLIKYISMPIFLTSPMSNPFGPSIFICMLVYPVYI